MRNSQRWVVSMGLLSMAITLSPAAWASHTGNHFTVPDLRYNLGNAPNPFVDHYVDTGCLLYSSSGECGKWGTYDRVLVKALTPFPDFELAGFIDMTGTGPPPGPPSTLSVRTFYGIDFDPNSDFDSLQVTGFSAAAPEVSFSGETYIGLVDEYPADFLGLFAIGDLGASFPDLDLSRFVGDPASVVYVFSAEVPASDFAVIPEPSTLLLAGVSGIALVLLRSRRRGS